MPHEPLITNLTLFYQTLAALQHISPSNILLPPNQISLTAAHDAGLCSEAIDLLHRLPHLSSDVSSLPILPDGTQAVFYTSEDECLEWSRTPTYQDSPEIASSAFVLTNPNIYGTSLIYDTLTSKLLPWEAWGKHVDFEIAEMENLFEDCDGGDAKPADEILKSWIGNFITLAWVPFGDQIIVEPDEDEVRDAMRDVDVMVQYQAQFIQWSFRDVYMAAGWDATAEDLETASKDFDIVESARMQAEWLNETEEMLDRAYEQQWPWQKTRMELGGELADNQRARLLDAVIGDGYRQRHIEL
ncbi:hypothetical protein D6D24_06939 [Aureobasidium pullulans]|uniref:Uncharacterized protein n=1 Tax=Aureobasidium pullulans TaxID=5580 RepID=A0A4S8VJG1_AURPU|nr:hypothetical protein D6D24_06939 [Aureobasidium pullulans]